MRAVWGRVTAKLPAAATSGGVSPSQRYHLRVSLPRSRFALSLRVRLGGESGLVAVVRRHGEIIIPGTAAAAATHASWTHVHLLEHL